MRAISLLNGDLVITKHDYELINIINEHMGYDMSCVIEDLVEKSDYVKSKIESDLPSYEMNLEENRDAFLDLGDMLQSMSKELEKKKINRQSLEGIIDRMESVINQHI